MNQELGWSKKSWVQKQALQQPEWPDQVAYQKVIDEIDVRPPLVFAGEIRRLKSELALAQEGKAFLLQGGDCAEEFSRCTAPDIRETLKVILQMALILTYAGEKPVIKVGRIAGQYAKPRSKPTEEIGGVELPSYRGDIINSPEPVLAARIPDANRLLTAYYTSASTLNLLRAYTKGGFASLERVHAWNADFVKSSREGEIYEQLAKEIDKAMSLIRNIGLGQHKELNEVNFYTSHEALLLGYESALTRQDSLTGDWFDCSAHMLWIGDRTRQVDGAHVEFLRGVNNPIGIKIGPGHDLSEIKKLISRINPKNEPGRMTLITRFGANKILDQLPTLIKGVEEEGFKVLWSCDPMHGNTYTSGRFKTRNVEDIFAEIGGFFACHQALGTIPGGIHFELTGEAVTECIGGTEGIAAEHLEQNYATSCDPRLNGKQSLDLAFMIADLLKR